MKKQLSISLLILFSIKLFALEFSQNETQLIYKTLNARLSTRSCDNPDSAIKLLDDFSLAIKTDELYKNATTEARFVSDNMIALEKYSYMYEKDMKSDLLKPFILERYDAINAYTSSHENENLSAWYYLSSGDVINSSMQFIPQGTAIKLGLKEKDDYDSVVEKNPDIAFARINRALWYYFAPAIGGGSKNVAKADFKKAVEVAACDYEKYYANIYLSQIYFDEGKIKESAELLSQAENVLPGTKYLAFIRRLNDNKYSLLYYIINREKVDKKLGL